MNAFGAFGCTTHVFGSATFYNFTMYVCMYVCMYVMYVCMHMYIHVCMYVCESFSARVGEVTHPKLPIYSLEIYYNSKL